MKSKLLLILAICAGSLMVACSGGAEPDTSKPDNYASPDSDMNPPAEAAAEKEAATPTRSVERGGGAAEEKSGK